jgi:MFS transporter, DHA1 family, multidrug resistance protein
MRYGKETSPIHVVIAGRFITNIGLFMIVPFLTIYLTEYYRMASLKIGILFAILNFTRRGLGVLAGWASDRFGASRILVLGLLIEMVSYLSFTQARSSFVAWALVIALFGTGGSLNNIAARTLLAGGSRGAAVNLSRYYVSINASALIGPLIGAALLAHRMLTAGFVAAAALQLAFAVVSSYLLRGMPRPDATVSRASRMISALRDRRLVRYCTITIGGWFLITQFAVALPLTIVHQGQPVISQGPLTSANAIVGMAGLWLLGLRVEQIGTKGRLNVLSVSGLVLSGGWLICVFGGLLPIVIAVLMASAGEVLFCGVVDALAAALAPDGWVGLYLGYSALSWAVGGVLGSLVGGTFDIFQRHGVLPLYWAVLASFGLATALGIRLSRHTLSQAIEWRQAAAGAPSTAPGTQSASP